MKARIPQETANEQTIRKLYSLAEAAHKDTPGFVSMALAVNASLAYPNYFVMIPTGITSLREPTLKRRSSNRRSPQWGRSMMRSLHNSLAATPLRRFWVM